MKQLNAKILSNNKVASGFYKMRIESAYLGRNAKPGQFVEVRCSDSADPLLRRPLGAHRISKNGVEILYEVVGKGTGLLSKRRPGELLDVIGPLGNGFSLNPKPYTLNPILVAGGVGVAPLLALAEKLKCSKNLHVLIGARSKSHVLCEEDFKKAGAKVFVATEDGSRGYKGLITEVLRDFLNPKPYALNPVIYACGPNGMLKEVARLAKERRIPCQVSLEEKMACGVGVCLGCPVKVNKKTEYGKRKKEEYKMVCKDGPVFNAEEIAW